MNFTAVIAKPQRGTGVVAIHATGCNHLNLNAEIVGQTSDGTADEFGAYMVTVLDGSLDDGVVNSPWKHRLSPCVKAAR
jgi:hypothetical protein